MTLEMNAKLDTNKIFHAPSPIEEDEETVKTTKANKQQGVKMNVKAQTRYTQLFEEVSAKGTCAFIPFLMMGDPDFDTSLRIMDALVKNGADALELAMPFSDPVADGPAIQNATLRAFKAQMNSQRCFEMLGTIRKRYPQLPMGLRVYANVVCAQGMEDFYTHCAQVGVDSVLVLDVPVREYTAFYKAAQKSQIAPILICPLDAGEGVVEGIAQYGNGYTCLAFNIAPTGVSDDERKQITTMLNRLKNAGAAPAVQGFGISTPAHIKALRALGIQGAIIDSAVVQLIESHLENHSNNSQKMLDEMTQYAIEIKAACVG